VQDQLAWLYTVLQDAPEGKMFILSMHIPPGIMLKEPFWNRSLEPIFLYTLSQFQSKIVLVLGAHIHSGEIKAPLSSNFPDLALPIMLSPSTSPIFFNNPGYTILDIEDGVSKLVHWRHLQLYQYSIGRMPSFSTIKP